MATGPVTPKFNKERQRIFLEEVARTHRFIHSAEAAGVAYNTVRAELKKNSEFEEAFELAKKRHLDWIDKEVQKRATGYEEQLTFQGQLTGGTRTVFNPRLLELYAKRRNPEYVERTKVEQNTKHSGEVAVSHKIDIGELTPEKREAMKVLLGANDESPD